METVQRIQEVLSNVQDDVEKFVGNGNKAAGTRIRKAMQEIKTLKNLETAIKPQELELERLCKRLRR